jgi:predicted PurR-regulated permease PerM
MNKKLDIKKINEVAGLSSKILRIFLGTIFGILTPLFIGLIIAWLFDPFISELQKKGLKRGIGTAIVYIIFLTILALVIGTIIPLVYDQISSLPAILTSVSDYLNNFIDSLGSIDGFNTADAKLQIAEQINNIGSSLTQDLPNSMVNFAKSFANGFLNFGLGLIIGFFILVSFNNVTDTITIYVPKKYRKDTMDLLSMMNQSLRQFVRGALIDCTTIFVVSSLAFWAVGLKAPFLFGLFCAITNIIPYAGPYIGGIPAIIVGLSQSPLIGLAVLIIVVVVQFVEGNFFQPLIMSKTTKLHPVTIMIFLLIFGHFFGIFGMFISTPIIAVVKSIYTFYDKKYNFSKFLHKGENKSDEKA